MVGVIYKGGGIHCLYVCGACLESGKGFLGMEYNRSFRVGNGTNPIQVNGKSGTMTIVRLATAPGGTNF